jgi:hypothetical protein
MIASRISVPTAVMSREPKQPARLEKKNMTGSVPQDGATSTGSTFSSTASPTLAIAWSRILLARRPRAESARAVRRRPVALTLRPTNRSARASPEDRGLTLPMTVPTENATATDMAGSAATWRFTTVKIVDELRAERLP